jgi:hypothetical protein
MNRLTASVSACLIFLVVMTMGACGGGSGVRLMFPGGTALAIDKGQSVTINVTTTGDAGMGVTWTCSGAACTTLANSSTTSVTFNATGATGTATITATSIKQTTVTGSVTVTVTAVPAISTTQAQLTAAPATAGVAYSFAFTATGGAGTLTWSATGLPTGLSINSGTGAISGTAAAKGTPSITVTVTDSSAAGPKTSSVTLTLTINNPAPPTITTTQAQLTAAPAIAATAYGFTFHGTGTGTLTWTATGLPSDGLSLAAGTGIVSGTPTSKATVSFMLTVSDSFGQSSAATAFALTVNNPAAPTITTTQAQVTAAPGTVGTPYSFTFHDTGTGTLTWSAVGLPADGLSLNSSTGVVSGTPTSKLSVAFTLTVTDTFGQSTAATAFTITVNNPAAPVISTTVAQVPSATVNVPYSFTFQGSGFGTLTWSTTPVLTDGLSIIASTGKVSGTPTTATTLNFSVSLTDGLGQVTTVTGFSIVVSTESIAFTPSAPTTVNAGGTLSVNALVSNDAGSGGVNWTVTCASAPCGSFTASHTASGTATTYDAPPAPPSGGTVTITATAADAPSPLVSAVVTVTAPPLSITTGSLPNGTINASYNATITATGGVPPYTFKLDATSTALPANLMFNPGSPSATITGTPTATGTTNNIIVDVKDSEGTPMTAQMTFSLTVNAASAACGTGSESLLNGQYAILLRGFDANGPVGIGATFDADGTGHVAKLVGIEDINSNSVAGVQKNLSITSASSSYSVGSDHRGCLTIATSAGTQVFRFSLGAISAGVASTGKIIEFDSSGSNTAGVLRKQDTTAFATSQITGNFAFGVSGPEAAGGKFAAIGLLSLNGSGGFNNSPASVVDFNDNGSVDGNGTTYPASPVSLSQGSYTIAAANGRGIFSFLPGGGGTPQTVNTILYIVSSSELLILSSDAQSSQNLFTGSALKQTVASFSASSLSAKSILYTTGLGNNGGTPVSRVNGGIFTVTSTGNFSFSGQQNDGGNISPQAATGTYSVASDGRVTLAGGGGGGAPLFYLVSANKGFALFTDGSGTAHVESGFLEPQSGSPFSSSSAHTTYAFGTYQPEDTGVDNSTGEATFDGAGNITGTSDDNSSGTLSANNSISDTYSIDSTGLGSIPANCTLGTNCNNIFFVISPTKIILLKAKAGSNDPNLQVGEQ